MGPESSAHNEAALIERVRQGERAGFDALVSLYQQKGLAMAYTMVGNLEDAKDVLQEAFVRMYLNIGAFRGDSRFSTWFIRIVINCALDFLRKRKRLNRVFVRDYFFDSEGKERKVEVADTRLEPAKILLTNELRNQLDEQIGSLPEKQRLCFVMRHQNGLSVREIAEILKCRPATVKVHLFRAVASLQIRLSKYV